jgi:hypothetical protein
MCAPTNSETERPYLSQNPIFRNYNQKALLILEVLLRRLFWINCNEMLMKGHPIILTLRSGVKLVKYTGVFMILLGFWAEQKERKKIFRTKQYTQLDFNQSYQPKQINFNIDSTLQCSQRWPAFSVHLPHLIWRATNHAIPSRKIKKKHRKFIDCFPIIDLSSPCILKRQTWKYCLNQKPGNSNLFKCRAP